MLKIRMQRIGRINMPAYRIIVAEHTRSPKTGNIVEKVGTYNPKSKERKLDAERIKYWISVGAKPSPTVHNMLITEGIISGRKINVLPKKSPPRVDEPASTRPSLGGQTRVEAGPPAKAPGKPAAAEQSPAEEPKLEEKAGETALPPEEQAADLPADLPAGRQEPSAQAGAPSEEAKEDVKVTP